MSFELKPIKREIEIEGFNSIYYFEFGKDFSHSPEKHKFWEMVYVDMGEINAVTDGIGQTLKQGQVIFHSPMEVHAHISNKIVPNNMLVVSFTTHSEAMNFFDKKVFNLDKTSKTLLSLFIKEAKSALGNISNEYSNKSPLDFKNASPESLQLLECYLTEFLLILKRSSHESAEPIQRSENSLELAETSIFELIVGYLENNIYSNLSLRDLCAEFLMGKSKLCKIFADHIDKGPIEYFYGLKIQEAKNLLRNKEVSISHISDKLGYSSIHNFSRAFKKATGVSPSEYRKKINYVI